MNRGRVLCIIFPGSLVLCSNEVFVVAFLFVKYIYVAVVMKMSAEVGVSDEDNTRASNSTVQRYESLDEKVELLIERMSECLTLVKEYMQSIRMPDGQYHHGKIESKSARIEKKTITSCMEA